MTEIDDREPEPEYIPIETAITQAEDALHRARVPVLVGAILIVGMTIGVLAAEGLPSGIRGVGLVVEMLVVFATFFFLLRMVKVARYLRTLDADIRDDEPAPTAEVAIREPGTAEWWKVRSARSTRLSVIAFVALAGMIVSGSFIGDDDPNRLAFSVALILFLVWGFTGFAAGISLLGRRAYRRRLERHPWVELECELSEAGERPTLGGPPPLIATCRYPDGREIELVLRTLVLWAPLPTRVDGQVHKVWWCSGDNESGCLATPGGAPVVIAGIPPSYVDALVEDAIEEQSQRRPKKTDE